jgi:uncharacterized membrane protein
MRKMILAVLLLCWLMPGSAAAQETEGVAVRALLFYSPTCPHCHQVIENVLLPMVTTYQDQLQILAVDVSGQSGSALYQEAVAHFQIPDDRLGVPTLIVGDTVLVGSIEIPEQFPGIVEEALAAEGVDWPTMPGLAQFYADLASADTAPTATAAPSDAAPNEAQQAQAGQVAPESVSPEATEPAPAEAAPVEAAPAEVTDDIQDVAAVAQSADQQSGSAALAELQPEEEPLGFALGGLVLLSMVLALGFTAWRLMARRALVGNPGRLPDHRISGLAVPVLTVLGLGVAAYLAYVEISHVEAVCGPVGQCNVVQSSPYAQILGIPVAVLGLLAYAAMMILWLIQARRAGPQGYLAASALLALTVLATLFSVYLTLLELLVIRAVCAWCLSSAVISTVLMLVVVGAQSGWRPRRAGEAWPA